MDKMCIPQLKYVYVYDEVSGACAKNKAVDLYLFIFYAMILLDTQYVIVYRA